MSGIRPAECLFGRLEIESWPVGRICTTLATKGGTAAAFTGTTSKIYMFLSSLG